MTRLYYSDVVFLKQLVKTFLGPTSEVNGSIQSTTAIKFNIKEKSESPSLSHQKNAIIVIIITTDPPSSEEGGGPQQYCTLEYWVI